MEQSLDFENQSIGKLFSKICIPTVLAMIISAVYIIVDGIFVGQGIGSDALAAVNIVVPLFTVFTGIGLLLGIGSSVMATIRLSEKDPERSCSIFTSTFKVLIVVMILVTILLSIVKTPLCRLLGANDVIINMSVGYLQIMMYYSLFFTLSTFLPFFVRLDGAPKLAMITTIMGGIINIILDYVFIFVFEMGVQGAALATGIGNIFSVCILIYYLWKKSSSIKFVKSTVKWDEMKEVCLIGFSALLTELCVSFSTIAYNMRLMNMGGEDAVSAYGVINYIHPLFILVFMAIGQSIQPIVSYNYGAKAYSRVKQAFKIAMITAFGVGAGALLVGAVGKAFVIALFLKIDVPAYDLAVQGLPLFFSNYLFVGLNTVIIAYYQSITDSTKATVITVLRGFVFVLLFVLLLPMIMGINGVWLSIPLSEMLGCILAFYLLKKKPLIA